MAQSEYGVKISNYQASSIWDKTIGVRSNYNTTPAMLTNSLFLDFLQNNGLRVNKQGFTTDVICLQFDSGSDSYKMALDRMKKTALSGSALKRGVINYKLKKSNVRSTPSPSVSGLLKSIKICLTVSLQMNCGSCIT